MGFDAQNFGFGMVAGWASAYAVYRYRHVINSVVASAQSGATTAKNRATRSADARYINDLIKRAQRTHLAGKLTNLTDVLVEPRFLPVLELAAPPEDEVIQDVFYVVPRTHDLPHLHAPYNVPTVSIGELGDGSRKLALLGLRGSGRTTALMSIALYSLNKATFKDAQDAVQKIIDEEEAKLSEKERAARVQERVKIEQQAKEKLAQERGVTFESKSQDELAAAVPLFNRLMPLYVHMADVHFMLEQLGTSLDPSEPLVRALQSRVGRVTASTIPGNVYDRLNEGQVLLLVDGLDDLPEAHQPRLLNWLDALMRQYDKNFFIVTGPSKGYGGLTQLGLTPVFLRPWARNSHEKLVELWADAYPTFGGKRSGRAVSPEQLEQAKTQTRCLNSTEMTFKTWTAFADEAEEGVGSSISAFIKRSLSKTWGYEKMLPILIALANLQVTEGFITAKRMEALHIGDALLPEVRVKPTSGKTSSETVAEATEKKKDASIQSKIVNSLRRDGILVRYSGGNYQFCHPLVADYCASLGLQLLESAELQTKLGKPEWQGAFAYAMEQTDLDAFVAGRVRGADAEDAFMMANWLRFAPSTASWRGLLLKQITNQFIAPNQYPAVRERAAAALVGTGDDSIVFILRKAARNANADTRRLACLAMGAMGSYSAIGDLRSLIQDPFADVQLAAGLSLGAIATQDALEAMVIAFTEDSEHVRKTMAEAFAALPLDGHPILYDAIRDDDMMLRRASIAGIRRIRAPWAESAIFRTFLQDEQWYVRSAAEEAFLERRFGRKKSLTAAYPQPNHIEWLGQWAAERGIQRDQEQDGYELLVEALQDEETMVRSLSAQVLGQLGAVDYAEALYEALRDRSEEVRAAAHRALTDLQVQLGVTLPTPQMA
jgi:HEAT repeat protein